MYEVGDMVRISTDAISIGFEYLNKVGLVVEVKTLDYLTTVRFLLGGQNLQWVEAHDFLKVK